jgi:PKD repeat protein
MSPEKTKELLSVFLEIAGCSLLFVVFISFFSSLLFQNYINVEMPLPIADFSADQTVGRPPLYVSFTDMSKGQNITNRLWDFGDGSSETIENPVHPYTKEGKYNVSLTVWNPKGQNTKTAYNYIRIGNPPIANFSASPADGTPPLTVSFTDLSEGSPTSWKWSFGNGVVSTVQNPEIIYSELGDYTVTLTVANETGSYTKNVSNCIHVGRSNS